MVGYSGVVVMVGLRLLTTQNERLETMISFHLYLPAIEKRLWMLGYCEGVTHTQVLVVLYLNTFHLYVGLDTSEVSPLKTTADPDGARGSVVPCSVIAEHPGTSVCVLITRREAEFAAKTLAPTVIQGSDVPLTPDGAE